ncbi:MAG: hypothetical protein R2839_04710 [Thermomicrobiales bacterium]
MLDSLQCCVNDSGPPVDDTPVGLHIVLTSGPRKERQPDASGFYLPIHRQGISGVFGVLLTLALIATSLFGLQIVNAQDEDSLVGEYAVAIVRADVPTDLPDGYNYVGKWIINFNEDGTYTARRQDVGLLVSGLGRIGQHGHDYR